MAILMNLSKTSNFTGLDFPNAYWVVEDVQMQSDQGETFIVFSFNAYPNRESRYMAKTNTALEPDYAWGKTVDVAVRSLLYEMLLVHKASEIFPNGIPTNEVDQKNVLYAFVKERLGLSTYVDVLE